MPYIKKENRTRLGILIQNLINNKIVTPGELNYVITRLCFSLIKEKKYSNYNTVIGVLECVKQELYRRAVSVYEDEKKRENGDLEEFARK